MESLFSLQFCALFFFLPNRQLIIPLKSIAGFIGDKNAKKKLFIFFPHNFQQNSLQKQPISLKKLAFRLDWFFLLRFLLYPFQAILLTVNEMTCHSTFRRFQVVSSTKNQAKNFRAPSTWDNVNYHPAVFIVCFKGKRTLWLIGSETWLCNVKKRRFPFVTNVRQEEIKTSVKSYVAQCSRRYSKKLLCWWAGAGSGPEILWQQTLNEE